MRTARDVPTPLLCRNNIISRMIFCSAQAPMIRCARFEPIPVTRPAESYGAKISPSRRIELCSCSCGRPGHLKSRQYDHLVATNSSFRANRMKKECGPIRDPELRANCVR